MSQEALGPSESFPDNADSIESGAENEGAVLNNDLKQESKQPLSFIDSFLGTLIAPVATFRQLASGRQSELPAVLLVVLVFGLDAFRLTPAKQLYFALLNVPSEIICGVLLWLFSAGTVSLAALCFGLDTKKCRAAFITMGWSMTPWIFMGPISCFSKILGPAHVLLMAIPLAWILVLQLIAIKESFRMQIWQALCLVFLVPMLLGWYQLMNFAQALAATLGSIV